jgi:hypothetical protein
LPTNATITRLPEELQDTSAPLACYPPEADVLIRSRRRPNEVLTTPEQFERIRSSHIPGSITERWGDPGMWRSGGRRATGHAMHKHAK